MPIERQLPTDTCDCCSPMAIQALEWTVQSKTAACTRIGYANLLSGAGIEVKIWATRTESISGADGVAGEFEGDGYARSQNWSQIGIWSADEACSNMEGVSTNCSWTDTSDPDNNGSGSSALGCAGRQPAPSPGRDLVVTSNTASNYAESYSFSSGGGYDNYSYSLGLSNEITLEDVMAAAVLPEAWTDGTACSQTVIARNATSIAVSVTVCRLKLQNRTALTLSVRYRLEKTLTVPGEDPVVTVSTETVTLGANIIVYVPMLAEEHEVVCVANVKGFYAS